MKILDWFKRQSKKMRKVSKFGDDMEPRGGDMLQIRLKKRGQPVAGIYKTDDEEIRSPALMKDDHV